jgi:hypothetical protein
MVGSIAVDRGFEQMTIKCVFVAVPPSTQHCKEQDQRWVGSESENYVRVKQHVYPLTLVPKKKYLRQPSIDFDFCNLSFSGDVVYRER